VVCVCHAQACLLISYSILGLCLARLHQCAYSLVHERAMFQPITPNHEGMLDVSRDFFGVHTVDYLDRRFGLGDIFKGKIGPNLLK